MIFGLIVLVIYDRMRETMIPHGISTETEELSNKHMFNTEA